MKKRIRELLEDIEKTLITIQNFIDEIKVIDKEYSRPHHSSIPADVRNRESARYHSELDSYIPGFRSALQRTLENLNTIVILLPSSFEIRKKLVTSLNGAKVIIEQKVEGTSTPYSVARGFIALGEEFKKLSIEIRQLC